MKIIHTRLKNLILKIISEHASSYAGGCGNATQGADHLFGYIKEQINEEIYELYLNKCQDEFDQEYQFENGEPFTKGLMEARYFILRMFHISFAEYFKSMECHFFRTVADKECKDGQSKIPA